MASNFFVQSGQNFGSGSQLESLLGMAPATGSLAAQNPLSAWGGTSLDPAINSEVAAVGQIKAAQAQADATKYSADAQRFGYAKQLEGQKYSSDTQRYAADVGEQTAKYTADQQLAAANIPYSYKREIFGKIFPLFNNLLSQYMGNSGFGGGRFGDFGGDFSGGFERSWSPPSMSYSNPINLALQNTMSGSPW